MAKNLPAIFKKDRFGLILIASLLTINLVLRVWRIDQLLGFYYDQGRDALTIEKIIKGDLVLIGPTTGIEGVFLGPFYYYFLLPGYLIGQGNPVAASLWQTAFIVIGYGFVTLYLRRTFSILASLVILFLLTFSFTQIQSDRWLSNPAPSLIFGPLSLILLTKSFNNNKLLPFASFCLGILLQLEAATCFVLVVISLLIILLRHKNFKFSTLFLSLGAFILTILPLIIFELRNRFINSKNLIKFIVGDSDQKTSFIQIPSLFEIQTRFRYLANIFISSIKMDPKEPFTSVLFLLLLVVFIFITIKLWKNDFVRILSLWFFGILVFFLFYQGNNKMIYAYYFVPIIPLFIIYIGVVLEVLLLKRRIGLILALILVGFFFFDQKRISFNYLSSGVDGPTTVALGNQRQAIEYILKDAKEEPFNVDFYLPPVIPYPYEYLVSYYSKKVQTKPNINQVATLYTLHEVDPGMPEREEKWLKRQANIGIIEKSVRFGGIGVEKRKRINE